MVIYGVSFDGYFGRSESEALAIVRWCLSPSVIASLDYDQFARWVAPGKGTIRRQERLREIWQKACVSIGCEVGEAVRFEAKVMVEGLKQIREALGATEAKIAEIMASNAAHPEKTIHGWALTSSPAWAKNPHSIS